MTGPHLAVTSGTSSRIFELREGSLIAGRSADCDLELSLAEVSRQHCRFTWDGSACTVEDLGSARGTRVKASGSKR
jgi:pSer/pThr/pTyr-binding forkhead associated (FHA) protein